MSKPVIGVIFYSTYGHIATLAESVIKGVEASGAIVKPFQFQETLPEEVLTKMYAGSSLKPKYPIITPNDLKELDGFIIGAPTRYGRLPAQVSAFFDATGQLWMTGALVGKFVSMFSSSASQHGGQETTFLTTMPFFAHHGLVYVPLAFTQKYLSDNESVHGGTPYGVTTVANGDGSRQPTAGELELAEYQGKYFSDFVGTFVRGKHIIAGDSVAANAIPAETEIKEAGYTVDPNAEAVPTLAAPVTEAAAAPAAAPAAEAATTEKSAPAPTAVAPAAATAATTPARASQPKKKGGLFASCCGDSNID